MTNNEIRKEVCEVLDNAMRLGASLGSFTSKGDLNPLYNRRASTVAFSAAQDIYFDEIKKVFENNPT